MTYKVRLQYQATNNEVEYEALLKGLELAKSIEAESVLILGDSQLVIGQVNGTCEAKEKRMKKYLEKVLQSLCSNLEGGEHGSRCLSKGSLNKSAYGRV